MFNAPLVQKLDIVCFSQLPWAIAQRRMNEILPRFVNRRRVFCFEASAFSAAGPFVDIVSVGPEMWRIIPTLPKGLANSLHNEARQSLVQLFLSQMKISYFVRVDLKPMPGDDFEGHSPIDEFRSAA